MQRIGENEKKIEILKVVELPHPDPPLEKWGVKRFYVFCIDIINKFARG